MSLPLSSIPALSDPEPDTPRSFKLLDPSSYSPYIPPSVLAFGRANSGLCLIAASQFFFACMGLSVKYLLTTTKMSTLTLIAVRMGITGACGIAALLYVGDKNPILGPPGVRRLLAWRGLMGFMGLLASYEGLRGLSVSDNVVIGFLTPSVTAVIGYLLLNESSNWKEIVSGLISLSGVVLISRPPFIFGHTAKDAGLIPPEELLASSPTPEDDSLRVISVFWAFSCVLFSAAAYTTIRYIGDRAHAMHSINYFAIFCTAGSIFGLFFVPGPSSWVSNLTEMFLVILIGVFGFLAQVFVTLGLQREKAGRAGLAMYTQLFFSLLLELFLFHTVPSLLSMIGTIIILSSALWVAVSGMKQEQKKLADEGGLDEESQPISRSPSPVPADGRTVRGEHYSYAAVPIPTAGGSTVGTGVGGVGGGLSNGVGDQMGSIGKSGASQLAPHVASRRTSANSTYRDV